MTGRENQSFAVQVVGDEFAEEARQLMSWSGNPAVNPSLWFVGVAGPGSVVIRAAKYPRERSATTDQFRHL